MSDLDPRLQALIDKDEIRDCVYRFARAVDRHDWDLARTCYHPGGIDDHGVFRGDKDEYVDWVSAHLPDLAEVTMHLIGNVMIELDGDVAHSEAYSVAYHRYTHEDGSKRDFTSVDRYVDRFEKRDGTWLIAKRVCAFDWCYTVPFDPTVGFTFGADFTVGHRDRTDITYTGV